MTDIFDRLEAALTDCDQVVNDEQGISNDDVVLMRRRHSLFKIRYS